MTVAVTQLIECKESDLYKKKKKKKRTVLSTVRLYDTDIS